MELGREREGTEIKVLSSGASDHSFPSYGKNCTNPFRGEMSSRDRSFPFNIATSTTKRSPLLLRGAQHSAEASAADLRSNFAVKGEKRLQSWEEEERRREFLVSFFPRRRIKHGPWRGPTILGPPEAS